jgi:GxxExxY protein
MHKMEEKDLTYEIIGLIYQFYNKLGFGYQEKYYQRAFASLLEEKQIRYRRELYSPIVFNNIIIGGYYIDFLVYDKIIVEFKISNEVYARHFRQVIGYLETKKLKVGLLALITPKGIKIKRIIK